MAGVLLSITKKHFFGIKRLLKLETPLVNIIWGCVMTMVVEFLSITKKLFIGVIRLLKLETTLANKTWVDVMKKGLSTNVNIEHAQICFRSRNKDATEMLKI